MGFGIKSRSSVGRIPKEESVICLEFGGENMRVIIQEARTTRFD
jgi:hypothetical protein